MSKDGRFYLRLTTEERRMLDALASAIGLGGNASGAVRFLIHEKHRELGLTEQTQETKQNNP